MVGRSVLAALASAAVMSAGCTATEQVAPRDQLAFAIDDGACHVSTTVELGDTIHVPDGVGAFVDDGRLEAVFTSRRGGHHYVAVDVESATPHVPTSDAERHACGELGARAPRRVVEKTSGGETLRAWDETRGDRADMFIGPLVYDAPFGGCFGPPRAKLAAHRFDVPPGGLSGGPSNPDLADIGNGRFLLTWTQGNIEDSQIRAQPVAGWGYPIGSPVSISPPGRSVTGTARSAFTRAGAGVVVFLAASDKGFAVMATRVDCR